MTWTWLLAAVLGAALLVWRSLARGASRRRPPERPLILRLRLPDAEPAARAERRRRLEAALREALAGEGELEEPIGDGPDWIVPLYGADPFALIERVRPVLEREGVLTGARATMRHTPAGADRELPLDTPEERAGGAGQGSATT